MATTKLTVDGTPISDLWDYALRWVQKPDGSSSPALYHQGRRVIKPWKMTLEADVEEDKHGSAA
jgi:hypothetical protein